MRYRVLAGALILMIAGAVWSPGACAGFAKEDCIRLHVIANSDREADQAVKHLVRDAILDRYGDVFASSGDTAETERTISASLPAITSIAQTVLNENGMSCGVSSEYGVFSFPTRQYGDALLPAGEYRALRVVLGEGAGANWWCVLFPPLCVHDTSAREKADTSDQEEAEETEVEEDAEESGEDGVSDQPGDEKEARPKVKFKIAEWIKGIF